MDNNKQYCFLTVELQGRERTAPRPLLYVPLLWLYQVEKLFIVIIIYSIIGIIATNFIKIIIIVECRFIFSFSLELDPRFDCSYSPGVGFRCLIIITFHRFVQYNLYFLLLSKITYNFGNHIGFRIIVFSHGLVEKVFKFLKNWI